MEQMDVNFLFPLTFPRNPLNRIQLVDRVVNVVALCRVQKPRCEEWTGTVVHPLRDLRGDLFFPWDMNYPLVICNSLLLKMTIEIVDFPIENGDFP